MLLYSVEISDVSIHAWLLKYGMKTETGFPLDFKDHMYIFDIYRDFSPKQVWMKAAQVTASTCALFKTTWISKNRGIDCIYTLPTEADRNIFVNGKVNRIIAQNPILQQWVKDKDSVEQKQIGNQIIHFRGTFTKKAAIMVPSDLNVYDEVDASKQDVIEQYSNRLQHSKYKWEWYFSHPSAPGFGVDRHWQVSDQKHWFVRCGACTKEGYLEWPESIDMERQEYVCKYCHATLTNTDRRNGRWVSKYKDREYSGYWISLLMCPWVTAKEIIGYYKEKSPDYFYNNVLGLPYVGRGNKLTWDLFAKNIVQDQWLPKPDDSMVIGVDTGLAIDYVMGGEHGLFYHGAAKDYDELDTHMSRWKRAIAVVDAGGDLIGSRKFLERWRGRVFLCHTGSDRKTMELARWGTDKESGNVVADRNRTIQLVVDEFSDGRIPVHGSEDDWNEYWRDWDNLTRVKIFDPVTGEPRGYKWVRSGRDHRALATIYWRVGMSKFGFGKSEFVGSRSSFSVQSGPEVNPDMTYAPVTIDGEDPVAATIERLRRGDEGDWRDQ